ncbi:hypothetical protein ZWY2020_045573, partial [Hordeum vulgare]
MNSMIQKKTLLMIDSTSDQKDRPWFYFISSTSLVISITAL